MDGFVKWSNMPAEFSVVECLEDGTWSGDAMQCEGIYYLFMSVFNRVWCFYVNLMFVCLNEA